MNYKVGDRVLFAMYEKGIKIECIIISILGDAVMIADAGNERNKSVVSIKDISRKE